MIQSPRLPVVNVKFERPKYITVYLTEKKKRFIVARFPVALSLSPVKYNALLFEKFLCLTLFDKLSI